ncbi:MAG: tRNA pseudouridine(38-40) synthase TruA [Zoogloeaceae bacterium]|jgi:tRNA pseudouridine38-40 synthase|nr:tRNA pseudouridine(38-40) synthase TruA [Zoogloeaceae bacterium]
MARIALGLEYDGRFFHGWQCQKNLPTLQAALEAALSQIAHHPVSTHCAGRTDTGVHATHQVIHFDTEVRRPDTAWVRGVNCLLPPAMAVRWAQEVEATFHARFLACRRRYRYLLLNRPQRPGLLAGRVGWFHVPLELAPMQEAARCLIGWHDFSAFRAAECQAKTPMKLMTRAEVRQAGDVFAFDFEANAFLHHMIRNLVGCLVTVGKGVWLPERLQTVLEQGDRRQAAMTFSPDGLYFQGPLYDPAYGIPDLAGNSLWIAD